MYTKPALLIARDLGICTGTDMKEISMEKRMEYVRPEYREQVRIDFAGLK